MKNINKILLPLLLVLFSCNEYLDKLPDNRTTLDSKEKIKKILVSAYSNVPYSLVTELSSDNVMDLGPNYINTNRFVKQVAYWKDVTAEDSDSPKEIWEGCYSAIANANEALKAIKEIGESGLEAEKGEALMARAYAHFILVNVFAKQYNSVTSNTDLGIVYMEEPETKLNPKYKRETVKANYEKINRDIEEALPLINDEIYGIVEYHFNKSASYAFAARFNLYYENWKKAEKYATEALGVTPRLRDWVELGNQPSSPARVLIGMKAYIDNPANLLVQATNGGVASYFFPASRNRITHSSAMAHNTYYATTPWSSSSGVGDSDYNCSPLTYQGSGYDNVILYKIPYYFEYTDPVAGLGYYRTAVVPFTTDETLLTRAEAKILQGKYDEGLADINLWSANFYKGNTAVTIDRINEFYKALPYSSKEKITIKKQLNPKFNIINETQENLIHYLLHCRRILTMHEGLRWFDLKRYGIEVDRIESDFNDALSVVATLPPDDPRRAIQIPAEVISNGLQPNPR